MTTSGPLILIVEDEPPVRRFLRATLTAHAYRLIEAETAADAMRLATAQQPDLILLDLGLPDGDGIELTRRFREWTTVPIIVVSARGREADKVDALDAGADDYVTKPFGVSELLARVRVSLRHSSQRDSATGAGPRATPTLTAGPIHVDLSRREVTRDGDPVKLTPIEYKLLVLLLRHAGKVLTHRQILRDVWGPAHTAQTHYARVYMAELRKKLEDDPAQPKWLLTEPGVGYRLRDSPE